MPNALSRYALAEPEALTASAPGRGRVPATLGRLASRTADGIVDARIVLPWLLSFVGAPPAFAGLAVPLRDGLAPLVADLPSRFLARRRWAAPAALLVQGLALLAISAVALALFGAAGGAAILALAFLAGLGAGLRPPAAAETTASAGTAFALAAVLAALFGLALAVPIGPRGALVLWGIMLAGGLCVLAAALAFAAGPAASPAAQTRSDPVAALFAAPALAIPFLVAGASANPGEALTGLGSLILAAGLARLALPLVAGPRAPTLAAVLATLALAAALVLGRLDLLTAPLVLPALVFVLALADAAARAGLARRGGAPALAAGFLAGAVLAPFGPAVALAALTAAAALSLGAAWRVERRPLASSAPPP